MANEIARTLRKRLTPQEVKLWVKLRELKTLGFHFRRQAPVGRYIVDFVSFRSQLVIEERVTGRSPVRWGCLSKVIVCALPCRSILEFGH